MTAGYLLGLDLGTSAVKVMLLPVEPGLARATATVDLPIQNPRPGWSEQDPGTWWQGAAGAVRAVLSDNSIDPSAILGVAASGQMHGATLLDASGRVLRPCILWNDQRSATECGQITTRVGAERLLELVGNPALAGFTLPKLLWVRTHEPHVFERTRTVLLPKDYLNYCLSGEVVTEPSDASGTLLFDVTHRRWSEELADELGIPLSMLPPVRGSTEVIGRVTSEAAQVTGLREGTPVVGGGADNACAAVGAGVAAPGQALVSLGTSGTLVAPLAEPRVDPQGQLHTFCHAVPDTWYAMGVVLSAGGSLRWFRDAIAEPEMRRAAAEGRDAYSLILEEAATVPAGSEGLLFLPYLTGERTPHGDPHARGVFFGLSPRHSRAHLARSVVEGVTHALADCGQLMRAMGIEIGAVRLTGGGARSPLWQKILAAMLDVPVITLAGESGPVLGSAILAGTGVGIFPSVTTAVEQLVLTGEEMRPDPDLTALYRQYQVVYDSLYPALQEQFKALAALVDQPRPPGL